MKCLSFCIGFAALLTFATAQAAELPESIKPAGVLRLTVNSTYAPMEYRDPATNELVGLDIDLANELAKRLGVKRSIWVFRAFERTKSSSRRTGFRMSC